MKLKERIVGRPEHLMSYSVYEKNKSALLSRSFLNNILFSYPKQIEMHASDFIASFT